MFASAKILQTKGQVYKQLKKDPMNDSLQREYKNYVKYLNKVIKDAKIRYDTDLIEKKTQVIQGSSGKL